MNCSGCVGRATIVPCLQINPWVVTLAVRALDDGTLDGKYTLVKVALQLCIAGNIATSHLSMTLEAAVDVLLQELQELVSDLGQFYRSLASKQFTNYLRMNSIASRLVNTFQREGNSTGCTFGRYSLDSGGNRDENASEK